MVADSYEDEGLNRGCGSERGYGHTALSSRFEMEHAEPTQDSVLAEIERSREEAWRSREEAARSRAAVERWMAGATRDFERVDLGLIVVQRRIGSCDDREVIRFHNMGRSLLLD